MEAVRVGKRPSMGIKHWHSATCLLPMAVAFVGGGRRAIYNLATSERSIADQRDAKFRRINA
jgi:hypothetical protein